MHRSTLVAKAHKDNLNYAAYHTCDSNTVRNGKSGEIVCIGRFLLNGELFFLRGLSAYCEFIFIVFDSMLIVPFVLIFKRVLVFEMASFISAMESLFKITCFLSILIAKPKRGFLVHKLSTVSYSLNSSRMFLEFDICFVLFSNDPLKASVRLHLKYLRFDVAIDLDLVDRSEGVRVLTCFTHLALLV